MRRPKWRTRKATSTSGARASALSAGLIASISVTAPAKLATVFAVYMIPGPSTVRTADMSFEARLISSPIRLRW